ncbi:anoctamin-1-like isoform X2 [Maniola hyperantus]|uniref:anoctamin-1-like isoform X2 n=1 Tax=Aphantopus hyperantus TaxID=2795564 RepID=UPI001567EB49|nr:anoctamin-1-like isoform X2 [Maniola hyperantus]
MSDGDPSLEEDVPKPLLEKPEENVFTPKIATPIFAGSVKLHHRPSDSAETESFLSDAQRNDLAFQQLFQDGDGAAEVTEKTPERIADLHAMSVLSAYQDTLSQDMNTDRDNGSDASTRPAEECACGEPVVPDVVTNNGKPVANHCSIVMGGILNNPSLTFNDGVRSVDFVLVWEAAKDDATTPQAYECRKVFERNLENEGLQLEREAPEDLYGLHFIKIHAPLSVLRDYSEVLKLRMPMKFSALKDVHEKTNSLIDKIDDCWDNLMSKIRVDPNMFPERKHRLTAIYSKDKEYLFDTGSECFWTPSIRSRIVQFILDRKKFSDAPGDDFAFGVARLIADNAYSAAYPLHDGDLKTPGSMRYLLYTEWASVSKCLKYQPLDYVKDYFGVKIGLYFAWLGFYTHMLIPASLVGLICVIYSAATVFSNKPSEDVCNYNSSIRMCPQCDYFCEFWDLRATCLQSRITYLFDNPTTVFFAIFMSFWAACFLELWKRYSAEMTHRWDLTGFDVYEEHPRPQYLARLAHVKRTQLNVVTGEREPMVPFWRMRLPAALMSFSVVSLLVLLALATVLGVVLYRMSLLGASILRQKDNRLLTYSPIMFTTATAACINLVFICIFNYIYQFLAEWLTEKELLRTQTEFDDSLTLKIYLLQFVNYYASIFYIAFFKGKFVGRPGNYVRLFSHRQEECAPGGCLLELSIQLAIIMIGKQFINTIVEMMMPYLLKWWNIIRTIGRKRRIKSPMQWVKDFKLVDFGNMGLFPEYLEMVLQYGFVTIFVAAFPLAPLFALINNVLEMRLDAKKFLTCYRRPVPQRVNDIGVWYRILDSIGKLSIITNGFIIAFTSEFIPRLVYLAVRGDLDEYVNHTLTDFNITVLEHPPIGTKYNGTMCSYPGYWNYKVGDDYEHTNWYWHVMGARLAFVVVFENVVALVMIIVRWAIPDMSAELRDRIRREAYVINSFIMEETRTRSAVERSPVPARLAHEDERDAAESTWNHIASLSGSDFDLAAHGDHQGIRSLAKHVVTDLASNASNAPDPAHV